MVMDWMWGTVLPAAQPVADTRGFGKAWRKMCEKRTEKATRAAEAAATAMITTDEAAAFSDRALVCACVARNAFRALTYPSSAPRTAAYTTLASRADDWLDIDPVGLLERLVAVGGTGQVEVGT